MTIFTVIVGEPFTDTLNSHMAGAGVASYFFFMSIMFVGNYIFLSLLLAVMLRALERFEEAAHHAAALRRAAALTGREAQLRATWSATWLGAALLPFAVAVRTALAAAGEGCRRRDGRRCAVCGGCRLESVLEAVVPAHATADGAAAAAPGDRPADTGEADAATLVRQLTSDAGLSFADDHHRAVLATLVPAAAGSADRVAGVVLTVPPAEDYADTAHALHIQVLAHGEVFVRARHGARIDAAHAEAAAAESPVGNTGVPGSPIKTPPPTPTSLPLLTVDSVFDPLEAPDEESDAMEADLVDAGGPKLARGFSFYMLKRAVGHKSLGLFAADHPLRVAAARLVTAPAFEALVLLVIFASCVTLALQEPCYYKAAGSGGCADRVTPLRGLEIFFAVFFSAEVVARVLAQGLLFHPTAFLQSWWCILDLFVVGVSIFAVAAPTANLALAFRAVRAMRGVRVLRVLSFFKGTRVFVVTIARSAVPIARAAVLVLIFVFIAAVFGMQLLSGSLSGCNDPTITTGAADCTGTFFVAGQMCKLLPTAAAQEACEGGVGVSLARAWAPNPRNFDNIGAAMRYVFELMTTDDWCNRVVEGMSAVGPGLSMREGANPAMALFYIVTIMLLHYFLLDLLIGVLVESYSEAKAVVAGTVLLSPAQQHWLSSVQMIAGARPERAIVAPEAPAPDAGVVAAAWVRLRRSVYALVTSTPFVMLTYVAITTNVAVIGAQYAGMPLRVSQTLDNVNDAFAFFFLLEAALKVLGLGPTQYAANAWNVFDFVLALAGAGSSSAALYAASRGATLPGIGIATLLRSMRVVRLLRLRPTLRLMLRLLLRAMPSFVSLLAVLSIILFMFAILGMWLFSGVRAGALLTFTAVDGGAMWEPGPTAIGGDANFDTFAYAFHTLYHVSMGEKFGAVEIDLRTSPPYCDASAGNCGSSIASGAFIAIFTTIAGLLALNLLVCVLLDTSDAVADDVAMGRGAARGTATRPFRLGEYPLATFTSAWTALDRRATGFAPADALPALLKTVPLPLGVANTKTIDVTGHGVWTTEEAADGAADAAAAALAARLRLARAPDGRLTFHATLLALVIAASDDTAFGAAVGGVRALPARVVIRRSASIRRGLGLFSPSSRHSRATAESPPRSPMTPSTSTP